MTPGQEECGPTTNNGRVGADVGAHSVFVRLVAASKPRLSSADRLEQARIEGKRFYRDEGDARRRVVIVIDLMFTSGD